MTSIIMIDGRGDSVTMTSLELVDFINSQRGEDEAELRHDHFMVKVPKVLGEMAPKFLGTIEKPMPNGGSREYSIYNFPKREACLMAMSYSYEVQAKVFDRMTMLEAQALALSRFNLPQTYAAAMRLAADEMEKREALQAQLTLVAPKIAAHDRIADAEGSVSIREAANTLRVPERKFVLWLQQNDWCYRRAGHKSLLGYAEKVKAGYLYLKQTPVTDMNTGQERLREQVRITPLGLTVLAKRLAAGLAPPGQHPAAGLGMGATHERA
nr:phage antirepressor KilAC domain-containing protein [Variovorax boronicumulans]